MFARTFIPLILACSASHAEMALVLSDRFTLATDGSVAVSPGAGTTVEVTPADGGYAVSIGGSVEIVEGASLAVAGEDGCLTMSIEQSFASPDLFEELLARGTDEYDFYGPSLVLEARLNAEVAAGIELCIEVDRPLIMRPLEQEWSNTQWMAVRQVWTRDATGRPRIRLTASPQGSLEGSGTLEAYCMDSERDAPSSDDRFVVAGAVEDEALLRALSNPNGLSPFDLGDCVWAARASTDRFARDVLSDLIDLDPEAAVPDLRQGLLRTHRDYLSTCPTMTSICDDDEECDRMASRSTPWSDEYVTELVAGLRD